MPTGTISAPTEVWNEIRKASELGVDDVTLAGQFEVTREAIRKRRAREGWITAEKLESQVEEIRARRAVAAKESQQVTAIEAIGESLLANGEKGSLITSNLALKLLQAAHANPNSLKPLADIYDLTAGMKAVRMAAGMDKQTTAVQVNLGSFFRPASGSDGGGCVVVDSGELVEPEN